MVTCIDVVHYGMGGTTCTKRVSDRAVRILHNVKRIDSCRINWKQLMLEAECPLLDNLQLPTVFVAKQIQSHAVYVGRS